MVLLERPKSVPMAPEGPVVLEEASDDPARSPSDRERRDEPAIVPADHGGVLGAELWAHIHGRCCGTWARPCHMSLCPTGHATQNINDSSWEQHWGTTDHHMKSDTFQSIKAKTETKDTPD